MASLYPYLWTVHPYTDSELDMRLALASGIIANVRPRGEKFLPTGASPLFLYIGLSLLPLSEEVQLAYWVVRDI